MIAALPIWLLLGLLVGLGVWPYQLISELGFELQRRLWPLTGLQHGASVGALASPVARALLVFTASLATIWLSWGPLAAGRGGGLSPLLALQRDAQAGQPEAMLNRLNLPTQLRRLPLIVLTHLGGLTVGVESPSAALGASLLLAIRARWPRVQPLAALPGPLLAAIGGGAGLGAAFRSPLLGVAYGLEELSREKGLPLVLPTLLVAGSGALVSTRLGQPARLEGLQLGPLPAHLLGWALILTLVGAGLGALFVRLLIPLSDLLASHLRIRRLPVAVGIALALTLLAILSDGLSLNDGSLSLEAVLQGHPGGSVWTVLWRFLAGLLSIAAGAPGGLMHDAMSLGGLLVTLLGDLQPQEQAQLAAIGATALFAAANGTPIFCGLFVFTLQGDPLLLPVLLLVSAISAALAASWRGPTWNEAQLERLIQQ